MTTEPWLEPIAWAIRSSWSEGPVSAARAAYDAFKRLGMLSAPDNPDFDATDGAHPAWWRGEQCGTTGNPRDA